MLLSAAKQERGNEISVSNGFFDWLLEHDCSLAFTSYDSGNLFFVGNGSIVYRPFGHCMGLAYKNETLFVAADRRIYELENIQLGGEKHDAVFVPRRVNMINWCDAHELAIAANGEILFAATSYSCVAKLDKSFSFQVVCKPDWISKIAPEDRCHLNGLFYSDVGSGTIIYSIIGKSDSLEGWRNNRQNGGMILTNSGDIIASSLSMPHSPRIHNGNLFYLDSGRGYIVNAATEEKIFCPGFLRGLSFIGNHAIVTVSKPREGIFKELDLQTELDRRGGVPWCGILIVNLDTGAIENWLKIEGNTRELFDVVALPYIKCPTALAPADPSGLNRTTLKRGE